MGLGEMRRGRVDTLYSEQESIRFVVKKTRFVPFLQRVAVSQTRASGSPGRSGELRLSRNCAACQLTPAPIRLPRNPGPPVFHKSPDQSPAGPVFSGPIRQAIPSGNSVRQFRQAATTCLPDDPSSPIKLAEPDDRPGHTPSPAPCRPPRRLPHPGRGPYRLPGPWGPGLVLPTGRSPFPSHQPTCMLVSRGAVCEVRFLPDGGVAACRLSR
jgi:hypothetical protein